jgi:hypothetical protein
LIRREVNCGRAGRKEKNHPLLRFFLKKNCKARSSCIVLFSFLQSTVSLPKRVDDESNVQKRMQFNVFFRDTRAFFVHGVFFFAVFPESGRSIFLSFRTTYPIRFAGVWIKCSAEVSDRCGNGRGVPSSALFPPIKLYYSHPGTRAVRQDGRPCFLSCRNHHMLLLCVICTLTLADLSNQSKQGNIRSVESREKKKPNSSLII